MTRTSTSCRRRVLEDHEPDVPDEPLATGANARELLARAQGWAALQHADTVSSYADEHGGWKAVADQWLQPGALDHEGLYVTYKLLYSASADSDPEVLG